MELADYWSIIRRRWKVVVLVFVVTLAAAAAVTFSMTPQYASTTRLFVSTSESETSTAINLSITLARAGHSVALVEADLRRPLVSRRLELDGAVGTTSVLIGKLALADAVRRNGGVDVLPCGPGAAQPLRAAAVPRDGHVAGGPAGRLRRGRARRPAAAAGDRLESVGGRLLGVVVNMAPARRSHGGYGYGYGDSEAAPSRRARREQRAVAQAAKRDGVSGARRR